MDLIENNEKIEKTISNFIKSNNKILKNKGIKLKEINEASKKGWVGLSLNELDYDTEDLYQRLIKSLEGVTSFGKDELMIVSVINSIRKDKVELLKFIKTQELKEKELQLKYESEEQKLKSKMKVEL